MSAPELVRVRCPWCGRSNISTLLGRLYRHRAKPGRVCLGSGKRVNLAALSTEERAQHAHLGPSSHTRVRNCPPAYKQEADK